MNKRSIQAYFETDASDSFGFTVCAALFCIGALAGAIASNYISSDNGVLLKGLFQVEGSAVFASRDFLAAFFGVISYHLLAVFLGFAVFGFVLLPLLAGVRGFMLSFVAAALIRTLGKGGFYIAFLRFGIPALISVPCFFILSVQAFNASAQLTGKFLYKRASRIIYGTQYFRCCAFCAAALIIAAILEAYIAPLLAAMALARL